MSFQMEILSHSIPLIKENIKSRSTIDLIDTEGLTAISAHGQVQFTLQERPTLAGWQLFGPSVQKPEAESTPGP